MLRMLNRRVIAVALAVAGVAFTAAPAMAAPSTVTLPGTASGWQSTGITVAPAHPVQLSATGNIDYGCNNFNACAGDPDGIAPSGEVFPAGDASFLAPGLRIFSLVGKIGNGAPFQLGKGPIVLTGDGALSIAYNDTSWGDNIGSYTVTLNTLATDTPGTVGGSVPATLSLTLGQPASFGNFAPGAARDYLAQTQATVISTAGDATLSVADPSSVQTGHLVNGAFFLPQALQARANTGSFAVVGSSAAPTNLWSFNQPVSNSVVAVEFKQTIGANDALRSGSYAKPLTFTLSTTTP
jgi:hypothetical protein